MKLPYIQGDSRTLNALAVDHPETMHELAVELGDMSRSGPLHVELGVIDAFTLIACLQLAWRHPNLSHSQRAIIETFANQLSHLFDAYPTAKSVLKAGWDSSMDSREGA